MPECILPDSAAELFAQLGSAYARNETHPISYTSEGNTPVTVNFLPSRLYTINGTRTCQGTIHGRPARIHIELDTIAIITLLD